MTKLGQSFEDRLILIFAEN